MASLASFVLVSSACPSGHAVDEQSLGLFGASTPPVLRDLVGCLSSCSSTETVIHMPPLPSGGAAESAPRHSPPAQTLARRDPSPPLLVLSPPMLVSPDVSPLELPPAACPPLGPAEWDAATRSSEQAGGTPLGSSPLGVSPTSSLWELEAADLRHPTRKVQLCDLTCGLPAHLCHGAHGRADLRPGLNPRWRVVMCRFFPYCRAGEACHFAHSPEELAAARLIRQAAGPTTPRTVASSDVCSETSRTTQSVFATVGFAGPVFKHAPHPTEVPLPSFVL